NILGQVNGFAPVHRVVYEAEKANEITGCRKSGLRHFFEVFIAPLRLRRGQGAMQGNPCYARLFADLTRMSPNPIKASGGCGPRTPRGFSTGCATPPPLGGGVALPIGLGGLEGNGRPWPAKTHPVNGF